MFSDSLSTGDGDSKVSVRANREHIFADGKAFVKAKIVFVVHEPVYVWRLTQTFTIDEILSDADIGTYVLELQLHESDSVDTR